MGFSHAHRGGWGSEHPPKSSHVLVLPRSQQGGKRQAAHHWTRGCCPNQPKTSARDWIQWCYQKKCKREWGGARSIALLDNQHLFYLKYFIQCKGWRLWERIRDMLFLDFFFPLRIVQLERTAVILSNFFSHICDPLDALGFFHHSRLF